MFNTSSQYQIVINFYNMQKNKNIPTILTHLPQSFLNFLNEKNIDLDLFEIEPPRYFRLKPNLTTTIQQLAQDLKIPPQHIHKRQDFYQIPSHYNINHSKLYNDGKLYGMDISSGWVIKALSIKQNLNILQLCCAPGNKLMYIRDLMKQGTVTGVDISIPRIEVTKNLIKKYGHENHIVLYCEDGTIFNKKANINNHEVLYDRVLVDAQCTHEGSLKHLKKFIGEAQKANNKKQLKLSKQQRKQFEKNNSNIYTSEIKSKNEWTNQDFEERFLDKKKLDSLRQLQSKLLENGFSLLVQGGYLVYSTCSFDKNQNEQIVQQFLKVHPQAELVLPFDKQNQYPYEKGFLQKTVRFNPKISKTGGMFIAKIYKKQK